MIRGAWIKLEAAAGSYPALLPDNLTPSEKKRAQGFKNIQRKRQYLAGRALLRLVAGSILGKAAHEIELSSEGCPALLFPPKPIWLSLSHSGTFVVAVTSDQGAIGVDIERIDQSRDWEALAQTLGLEKCEAQWTKENFFKAWTLREATFKAAITCLDAKIWYSCWRDFAITVVSSVDTKIEWVGPSEAIELTAHFDLI